MANAQNVTAGPKLATRDGKKVGMRLPAPPRKATFPNAAISPRTSAVISARRRLRVSGAVESFAWACVWFSLGVAASLLRVEALLVAVLFWVVSVAFARKRARLARYVMNAGGDIGARESLRAREALGGVLTALQSIQTWGDDARLFVQRETTPPPVDPEIPIPPNPVPRNAALTPVPPRARRMNEEPPPSHPSLSRDPDHDPKTCKVCLNSSEPPPYGPGSIRELPPYAPSFVGTPRAPAPYPSESRDDEELVAVDCSLPPDSVPSGPPDAG